MAKSMYGTMATFTVLGIAIPLMACSQSPGVTAIAGMLLPLNPSFGDMLNISEQAATIFSIPAMISTCFGFFFIAGKQLTAMGNSGYISVFQATQVSPSTTSSTTSSAVSTNSSETSSSNQVAGAEKRSAQPTSAKAYIIVACCGMTINCLGLIPGAGIHFFNDFFGLMLLSSFTVYMWIFFSYYIFKTKYNRVSHGLNPCGIYTPIVGFSIFLLAFISKMAIVDGGDYHPILYLLGYLALASAVYYFHSSKNITYSDEEQEALFGAYVIKGIHCCF